MLNIAIIIYATVAAGFAGATLWLDRGEDDVWFAAGMLGFGWPLWLLMAMLDGF